MDNFEKHIKNNKELFDEHKADRAKLWANIESELDKKPNSETKVVKLWQSPVFKIAAVIIVALGLFSLVTIATTNNTKENMLVNQELVDIDMHYKGLVSYQVKLVNSNTKLSQDEKKEFLLFMDELDEEYELLKLELHKNLDTERVLEAIVINYKKRIEIIENLLEQINDSNKMNENNEYVL
ncbi:hypothetical protein [Pontimicrobium sp. SW4]|uniref:Anti-sigma factor n=1 Tax=Pontimicrobium sp. SW4 TaxID=3153519 RepID=A0AAU7BX50_9FLAO